MADDLASSTVRIDPDLDHFTEELRAKLDEIMADVSATVNVKAQLDEFKVEAHAGADEVSSTVEATVKIKGNAEEFDATAAAVEAEGDSLGSQTKTVTFDGDASPLDGALASATALMEAFSNEIATATLSADPAPAMVALGLMNGLLDEAEARQIDLDVKPAEGSLTELLGAMELVDATAATTIGSLGATGVEAQATAAMVDELAGSFDSLAGSMAGVEAVNLSEGLLGAVSTAEMGMTQLEATVEERIAQIRKDAEEAGAEIAFITHDEAGNISYLATALDEAATKMESISSSAPRTFVPVAPMASFDTTGLTDSEGTVQKFASELDQLHTSQLAVNDALNAFGSGAVGFEDTMQALTDQGMDAKTAFSTLDSTVKDMANDMESSGPKANILRQVLEGIAGGFADLPSILRGTSTELSSAEVDLSGFAGSVEGVAIQFQAFAEGTVTVEEAARNFATLGVDAETTAQLLAQGGITAEEAFAVYEQGIIDLEGLDQLFIAMGVDAADAAQVVNMAAVDTEAALGVLIGLLGEAEGSGGGGGVGSFFNSLADGAASVPGVVWLIVAAVTVAIPLVGALIGVVGALSAIAFTGFAGIAALAIGATGDLQGLEAQAKTSMQAYQKALAPFVQPIINSAIPIINQGFKDMLPIAQAAAGAVGPLMTELNTDMSSNSFKQFIQWVSANTGPAITTISGFAGNFVKSLASMGENGQPFIKMIENGINSLGTDLAQFGASNTFRDFVGWLVQNAPVIGSDLEQIGHDVGQILVSLVPLGQGLLDTFTKASNIIDKTLHTAGQVVDAVLPTDTAAQQADKLTASISKLESEVGHTSNTSSGLNQKLKDLKELAIQLPDLWKATSEEKGVKLELSAQAQATFLAKIHAEISASQGDLSTYTTNVGDLSSKFDATAPAVEKVATLLGVDLRKSLTPEDLVAFKGALGDMASESQTVSAQVKAMDATLTAATKNMITAGDNAAAAAQSAWSSYGSAVTFFANSTIPPTAAKIEQFYTDQQTKATTFTDNLNKALAGGVSPALLANIAQAGPQASVLLQGVVNSMGKGFNQIIASSTAAMSKEGAIAVEIARETAMAVAAPTAKIAQALPIAQALYLNETRMNSAAAVQAVMTQYNLTLPQISQIAKEYGNAIPQAVQAQVLAAKQAASDQAAATHSGLSNGIPQVNLDGLGIGGAVPNALQINWGNAKTAATTQVNNVIAGLIGGLPTVSVKGNEASHAFTDPIFGAPTFAAATTAVGNAVAGLSPMVKQAHDLGSQAAATFGDGLNETGKPKSATAAAAAQGKAAYDAVNAYITNGSFNAVGKAIAAGIAAGIGSGSGAITTAATKAIGNALSAANAAANNNSPSRLFRDQVGLPLALGIAAGLTGAPAMAALRDAANKTINTAMTALQGHTATIGATVALTSASGGAVPGSVSSLGTGTNSSPGPGTVAHVTYAPQYHLNDVTPGDFQNMLEKHDDDLLETIKAL